MPDFQARLVLGSPTPVPYTPVAAVGAGTVVVQGDTPRIANADIAAGARGNLMFGGVWEVKVNAAVTPGEPVWWDDTNNQVTETAAGNTHFGVTCGASYDADDGSGDLLVLVAHAPQGVTGAIV